jgi:voltage-gated potassium channel
VSPPERQRGGLFLALLQRRELTARRAGIAIALVTLAVTLAGGLLITVVDRKDFPNIGRGMWWAVQTVTTVGYGDAVPNTVLGRLMGTVVMVTGIGFIAVVTAAVTASFVETARRRLGHRDERLAAELAALDERLARIEELLTEREKQSGG